MLDKLHPGMTLGTLAFDQSVLWSVLATCTTIPLFTSLFCTAFVRSTAANFYHIAFNYVDVSTLRMIVIMSTHLILSNK